MDLASVVNIIGITVYVLLSGFFLWVSQLPNTKFRVVYWLLASISILLGRIDLFILSQWLPANYVQTIYAVLLSVEKLMLVLGLLHFFNEKVNKPAMSALMTAFSVTVLGIIFFNHLVSIDHAYAIWFAVTQAASFVLIAIIFWNNKPQWFNKSLVYVPIIMMVYMAHWLSFPLALQVDWYLPIGYLIGNILNIIVYFSFALMVLYRFQFQMVQSERSAKILAKEATQASQAKSDFLANMSHEIRTPMNGVLGMLDLLKQSELRNDQKDKVSIAYSSAKSLLAIINDILDFSKIEAGKLDIEYVDCDLCEVIEEVTSVMRQLAENKGLELLLDTTAMPEILVQTDANRVRQVLVNILNNAVKFTHEGEVLIKAAVVSKADSLQFNCSVTDTGVGIENTKLDSIFSSFQQADSSTSRHYGGTGLGLTISKSLCKLLGGDIQVASEKNKGSCFSISIPLRKSNKAWIRAGRTNFAGLRLLVVDDNDTNREILSKQFSLWNAEVVAVHCSDEALHIVQTSEKQFDIAIIDYQMPGTDGEQLGRLLKDQTNGKDIKLIMLSSVSDYELARRVTKDCFERFIVKPALSSELLNIINELTNKQKGKTLSSQSVNVITKWSDLRILLVEDNEINMVVAIEVLRQFNITCETAYNGEEALTALKQADSCNKPFALVLMDCQMPVLDGYEATKQIRAGVAGESNRKIPIIAMTANAMQGDREKCLAAGMDDYIAKPLDKGLILEALQRWDAQHIERNVE